MKREKIKNSEIERESLLYIPRAFIICRNNGPAQLFGFSFILHGGWGLSLLCYIHKLFIFFFYSTCIVYVVLYILSHSIWTEYNGVTSSSFRAQIIFSTTAANFWISTTKKLSEKNLLVKLPLNKYICCCWSQVCAFQLWGIDRQEYKRNIINDFSNGNFVGYI